MQKTRPDPTYKSVKRKEILDDFFFYFSSEKKNSPLIESIRANGLRTTLQVVKKEKGYQLVSGFKRFQIATDLKIDPIPVEILNPKIPIETHFKHVLVEQLCIRDLNLLEKARVLNILNTLHIPWDRLRKEFIPLLDLPPKQKVVDEVISLLRLNPKIQNYIEKYHLALKSAYQFNQYSAEEQDLIAEIGLDVQIRPVELLDITVMLFEVSKKENKTLLKTFKNLKISEILNNQELNRNEKIMKIKLILKQKRYPMLFQWNEDIQKQIEKFFIPEKMKIKWDKSLEKSGVQLQLNIQSLEDIEKMIQFLSDTKQQEKFNNLFKII